MSFRFCVLRPSSKNLSLAQSWYRLVGYHQPVGKCVSLGFNHMIQVMTDHSHECWMQSLLAITHLANGTSLYYLKLIICTIHYCFIYTLYLNVIYVSVGLPFLLVILAAGRCAAVLKYYGNTTNLALHLKS